MSTPNSNMVIGQTLTLTVQGVNGLGTLVEADDPGLGVNPVWTKDGAGPYVTLSSQAPDGFETLVTAVAVGTQTITVTLGELTQTYIIEVFSNVPVSLNINAAFAGVQNPPASGQEAGFGLGLGYQRPNL